MQSMLGAFNNQVDGVGIYDTYKKAQGNTLAGMAFNSQGAERQGALSKLAGINPGVAMGMQDKLGEQEKDMLAETTRAMIMHRDNPEIVNQIYAKRFVPLMESKLPETAGKYPQMIDAQGWQAVEQIANAYGGNQDGDTRWIQTVGKDGKPVWAAANNRGIAPTEYAIPDSYSLEIDPATGLPFSHSKRTGSVTPAGGGAPQREGSPTQFFQNLAGAFGAQITSINRTPEHNRKVGGVDNSYHLSGEAGDFVVPPQAKAQFMQAAQANGYQAIDEGDHIHLEPAKRGGGGYVGMSAAEKARAEAQAKADVSLNMDPKIDMAKAGVALQTAPAIEGAKAEATATGKLAGERAGAIQKKIVDANETIPLLDEAEKLLASATGGYFGAQADAFYGAFGKSTEGSRANAQLDVIAPKLIGMVPRMEGPQSDADRMLYQAAAGNLNDATKPASIRLASLKQMRRLAMKYANVGQQSAPTGNGWSYGGVK